MKKILITTIAICLFATICKPVFAADHQISDPSAKPSTQEVTTDERPAFLKAYLRSKHSPFADDAEYFVKEADRLNLNWKLVAAIGGVESSFGQHIPTNSYNAWGWGVFTGANDGIHFTSWKDGITKVSEGLRYNYIDKGAKTVDEIGQIYAASPVWSSKVKWIIADMEQFHPASSDTLGVTI